MSLGSHFRSDHREKILRRALLGLTALLAILVTRNTLPDLFAQNVLPGGTILPVRLNCSLNSKKSKAGQTITARIMQEVPLSGKSKIPVGSKVVGHILEGIPATAAQGAKISFRFDTLILHKQHIPVTTNLRAMASMMEVYGAQLPEMGADRGTSENAWVTEQVGGETVYHGGWTVTNGSEVVGRSLLSGGVLTKVRSRPGSKCHGETGDNHEPQALWVFASDACGTYGFENLSIAHAGRTDPIGQIVLASEKGNIDIRGGSGLLLRVIGDVN